MASLIHKGDRWTLQFRLRPDQDRATIALGAMDELDAQRFQKYVGVLVKAFRAGKPPDPSTANWVNNLSDDLHAKLAKAGLVIPRATDTDDGGAAVPTLEKFLDGYFAKRAGSKESTKTSWGHTKRCLIGFFGATRPLDRISAGEAEDFRRWLADDQKLSDTWLSP